MRDTSTLSSLTRTTTASVSVGVSLGSTFGVHASAGWRNLAQDLTTTRNFLYLAKSSAVTHSVRMMRGRVRDFFLRDVERLPELLTNETRQDYLQFISKWGTHYVESAVLGGSVTFHSALTEEQVGRLRARSVGIAAGLSLASMANIGASIDRGSSDYTGIVTENIAVETFGYGGVAAFINIERNYSEWERSVAAGPMPISIQLMPYVQLLANDSRRDSLVQALRDYVKGTLVADRYLIAERLGLSNSTNIYNTAALRILRPIGAGYMGGANAARSGSPANSLSQAFTFDCPANTFMTEFNSWVVRMLRFLPSDSFYSFGCSSFAGLTSGACTNAPLNSGSSAINYQAPAGHAISGISGSAPSGGWRSLTARICPVQGGTVETANCFQSGPVNSGSRQAATFGCPGLSVMTGIRGDADRNGGRVWSFTCCAVRAPVGSVQFSSFGDIVLVNQVDPPTFYSVAETVPDIAVQDVLGAVQNAMPLLAPPTSYEPVFAGLSPMLSIWGPVCPTGYRALGMIAMSGNVQPVGQPMSCVHARCAVPCSTRNEVFSSGDFSIFNKFSETGDMTLDTFVATNHPLGQVDARWLYCLRRSCLSPEYNITSARVEINDYWEPQSLSCVDNLCSTAAAEAISSSPSDALAIGLGVTFALLAVLAAVAVVLFFLYRRRQRLQQYDTPMNQVIGRSNTGANPFAAGSGVSTKGSDKGISAPVAVKVKTHVERTESGRFMITKEPKVGDTCQATYTDGMVYNGTVDAIENGRALVRWTEFTGRDWIPLQDVVVKAHM